MNLERPGPRRRRTRATTTAVAATAALCLLGAGACSSGDAASGPSPTDSSSTSAPVALPAGISVPDPAWLQAETLEVSATRIERFRSAGGMVQAASTVAAVTVVRELTAAAPPATPPMPEVRVVELRVERSIKGGDRVGSLLYVANGTWAGGGRQRYEGDVELKPGMSGVVFLESGPPGAPYLYQVEGGAFLSDQAGVTTNPLLVPTAALVPAERRKAVDRIAVQARAGAFSADISPVVQVNDTTTTTVVNGRP